MEIPSRSCSDICWDIVPRERWPPQLGAQHSHPWAPPEPEVAPAGPGNLLLISAEFQSLLKALLFWTDSLWSSPSGSIPVWTPPAFLLFLSFHICKQFTAFSSAETFISSSALPFALSLPNPAVPLLLIFSKLLIQILWLEHSSYSVFLCIIGLFPCSTFHLPNVILSISYIWTQVQLPKDFFLLWVSHIVSPVESHQPLFVFSAVCWVVKLCSWSLRCLRTIPMLLTNISVFQLLLLPRISFKVNSQRKTKTITWWCVQGSCIKTPIPAIHCYFIFCFLRQPGFPAVVSACWDWWFLDRKEHLEGTSMNISWCVHRDVQPALCSSCTSWPELDSPDSPAGNNLDEEQPPSGGDK